VAGLRIAKLYQSNASGYYSPPECIGTEETVITGDPDLGHISTSYVERQNLTIRMSMRRFTRLTNAPGARFHQRIVKTFPWYTWGNPNVSDEAWRFMAPAIGVFIIAVGLVILIFVPAN
jgi:hypothetical protein